MRSEILKAVGEIAVDENKKGFVAGYASVFNGTDLVKDTIELNAYDEILKGQMPAMLFNHDSWELPIGKWTTMRTDAKGLYLEGMLNLEQKGVPEIYQAVKFGSLQGLSVRLLFDDDGFYVNDDGTRHITKVYAVPEVSIVSIPCDTHARISQVKSIDNALTIRDFEKCLRDVGASRNEAAALIAAAKKLFAQKMGEPSEERELTQIAVKLAAINERLKRS